MGGGWWEEGREEEEEEGDLFLGMRWTFCSSSMDVILQKCSESWEGVREGGREGAISVSCAIVGVDSPCAISVSCAIVGTVCVDSPCAISVSCAIVGTVCVDSP